MPGTKRAKSQYSREVTIALIGLVGVLGAALITNLDKLGPEKVNSGVGEEVQRESGQLQPTLPKGIKETTSEGEMPADPDGDPAAVDPDLERSAQELIQILDLRAEEILTRMDMERQHALSSIRAGHGYSSEKGLSEDYSRRRALFLDLHKRNLVALEHGQLVLSHELTKDIHYLLSIGSASDFWSAYADRDHAYYVDFVEPNTFAEFYPGDPPADLKTRNPALVNKVWIDFSAEDNIDWKRHERIKKQLEAVPNDLTGIRSPNPAAPADQKAPLPSR